MSVKSRKMVFGLFGDLESCKKVSDSMAQIGATTSLGVLTDTVKGEVYPKIESGIIKENHIKQVAGKVGKNFPISKYAGKEVSSKEEASLFFDKLVSDQLLPNWTATYFMDNEFFRQKDGVYSIVLNLDEHKTLLSKLEKQYVPIFVDIEEKDLPSGTEHAIFLGEAKGGAVKKKVLATLNKIKEELERKNRK